MFLVESGTEEKELSALDVLSVADSSPEPLTELVPVKQDAPRLSYMAVAGG